MKPISNLKKRKESSLLSSSSSSFTQSSTLHDFFSKPTESKKRPRTSTSSSSSFSTISTSNKKPPRLVPTTQPSAKLNLKPTPLKRKHAPVNPADIIVIDSDDDDDDGGEVGVGGGRGEKAVAGDRSTSISGSVSRSQTSVIEIADSSSDVEFVEGPSGNDTHDFNTNTNTNPTSKRVPNHVDPPPKIKSEVIFPDAPFGKPCLLIAPTESDNTELGWSKEETPPPPPPSQRTLGLRGTPLFFPSPPPEEPPMRPQKVVSSLVGKGEDVKVEKETSNLVVDVSDVTLESDQEPTAKQLPPPDEGQEWKTGDDELDNDLVETQLDFPVEIIIETQYRDTEVDFDLTCDDIGGGTSIGDDTSSYPICPICLLSFPDADELVVQDHINLCLDESSPPNSPNLHQVNHLPSQPTKSTSLSDLKSRSKPTNSTQGSSAFSVLMTSHKENEAWKEVSLAEKQRRQFRSNESGGKNNGYGKSNANRRKAPFYKIMTGMPIAVDAFCYGAIPGVTAYFLTHAHSDHYTSLSSTWKNGPIYCSQGTANLIIHMLSVDPKWVHPLPMDVPTLVPDTGGVHVTLIEANHCPGSCLFLFEGPQTVHAGDSVHKPSVQLGQPSSSSSFASSSSLLRTYRYLHCGDFRASPRHVLHPAVKGKKLDVVYLDTTYLDPKYCFPAQKEVVEACAELARRIVNGEELVQGVVGNGGGGGGGMKRVDSWFTVTQKAVGGNLKAPPPTGRTLVVVGTYSIGKERIVKAVAKALNTKIYCDPRKTSILLCQPDPDLHSLLTSDPKTANVHLLPLGTVSSDRLKTYLERWKGEFDRVVGFRPTGWTYSAVGAVAGKKGLGSLTVETVIERESSRGKYTYSNLVPSKTIPPSSSTSSFNTTNIGKSKSTLVPLPPPVTVYGVPYSEHSSFFELSCFALSVDWGRMIATVNVGNESSRAKMARWFVKWEAERKKRWGRGKGGDEVVPYRDLDYW